MTRRAARTWWQVCERIVCDGGVYDSIIGRALGCLEIVRIHSSRDPEMRIEPMCILALARAPQGNDIAGSFQHRDGSKVRFARSSRSETKAHFGVGALQSRRDGVLIATDDDHFGQHAPAARGQARQGTFNGLPGAVRDENDRNFGPRLAAGGRSVLLPFVADLK